MKRTLILIVAGLFLGPVSSAQDIVKCTTDAGVTYQTEPCSEGTASKLGAASIAGPGAPVEGMSDIQVLNNHSWGKPQRITRNRAPRAWHEYWKYETGANSGKQLHFINGKLVGIEVLELNGVAVDTLPVDMIVER